jgi:hypothetical protein
MNPQVLIDAIVRQTTVLIAQLSTAEGARSPLAHLANEVFIGIVRELEEQGLGKKVIADMFGLALRSYRQKVQRLEESRSTRGVTLWTAIQEFLAQRQWVGRAELFAHFRYDEEASVRGILRDLVESGFVVRSGKAEETQYRVASAEELLESGSSDPTRRVEADAGLLLVHIYAEGPLPVAQLERLVPLPSAAVEIALKRLVADGRVRLETRGGQLCCEADECLIPVGESAGWEAAVVDHHRAVLSALAAKIAGGQRFSAKNDEVGGTTLTFELWPGHPFEAEVRRALSSTRERMIPLWERVAEHNRRHAGQGEYQVHFYCGQYVVADEGSG